MYFTETKETKEIKKTNLEMIKCSIGKDETRLTLMDTVYHCSKLEALCSTDGHKMSIISSMYDKELADKSINVKTYSTNNREFPRTIHSFNIKPLLTSGKTLTIKDIPKHLYVKTKKPTMLYLDTTNNKFTLEKTDTSFLAINAEFIKPFIGRSNIEIIYQDKLKPIYLINKNYDYYIIMPMRMS